MGGYISTEDFEVPKDLTIRVDCSDPSEGDDDNPKIKEDIPDDLDF